MGVFYTKKKRKELKENGTVREKYYRFQTYYPVDEHKTGLLKPT